MVNIFFLFVRFFPSFISNTSIVSINFRADLDAQNAGNCISGLQISNIFWGSKPPDPPIHAWYVGHTHGLPPLLYPLIYYLTERSLFEKWPPTGKSLKEALSTGILFHISIRLSLFCGASCYF
jgi:hypothetical protein